MINLKPYRDSRGYFVETYDLEIFRERGLQTDWKQENQSYNTESGIIRGLHFQKPPFAQTKLVRVITGKILDVFVDVRTNSSTFGQWDAVELSSENFNMVYIPKGCAHGFCTISEETTVIYKVDSAYAPDSEGGIRWDDKTLNIPWPLKKVPLISAKDAALPYWNDLNSPFTL